MTDNICLAVFIILVTLYMTFKKRLYGKIILSILVATAIDISGFFVIKYNMFANMGGIANFYPLLIIILSVTISICILFSMGWKDKKDTVTYKCNCKDKRTCAVCNDKVKCITIDTEKVEDGK